MFLAVIHCLDDRSKPAGWRFRAGVQSSDLGTGRCSVRPHLTGKKTNEAQRGRAQFVSSEASRKAGLRPSQNTYPPHWNCNPTGCAAQLAALPVFLVGPLFRSGLASSKCRATACRSIPRLGGVTRAGSAGCGQVWQLAGLALVVRIRYFGVANPPPGMGVFPGQTPAECHRNPGQVALGVAQRRG